MSTQVGRSASDQSTRARAGQSNTQQSNTQQEQQPEEHGGPSKEPKATRPDPEHDKISRMPGEPMMPKLSIRALAGNRIIGWRILGSCQGGAEVVRKQSLLVERQARTPCACECDAIEDSHVF